MAEFHLGGGMLLKINEEILPALRNDV